MTPIDYNDRNNMWRNNGMNLDGLAEVWKVAKDRRI